MILLNRDEEFSYQEFEYMQTICGDCGEMFFPHKDNYYVYKVCKDCLEKAPLVPYAGDQSSGKKDYRASLRSDGQEGDDYFG